MNTFGGQLTASDQCSDALWWKLQPNESPKQAPNVNSVPSMTLKTNVAFKRALKRWLVKRNMASSLFTTVLVPCTLNV